jgi:hypothetical protein
MPRLLDRNKQVPYGLKFQIPGTKWTHPTMVSFDTIVRSAILFLQGNPHVAQRLGWDISFEAIADRVDEYNALIMEKTGWPQYLLDPSGSGGASQPAPFPHQQTYQPPHRSLGQRLANVAAGGDVVVDWIKSKEEAVPADVSGLRASVCAGCRFNQKGDLLRFFTLPLAEAVRKSMMLARDWKMSTPADHLLGVCEVCDCPMRLKVHMPLKRVVEGTKPEIFAQLPAWCWIKKESQA